MSSKYERSQELFKKSCEIIPGGVNSPVRAFGSVDAVPVFMERGEGPYLFDEDGNRYIDYIGSWGPMILGHSHPQVLAAVQAALAKGFSFGTATAAELALAEQICQMVPSIDMVRLTSSGTEACMSAIRVARGFTKRHKIVKFVGCYHGHADMLLVQAGSGVATLGIPGSPGVPPGATADTLTCDYNDCMGLEALFKQMGSEIAAVILEPIVGNAGFIEPSAEFLESIVKLCQNHGSLMIFDEVMTGFRVAPGGAQELFKMKPDLTTLGKVIGGGMPIGAYGGRKDIMESVAPAGNVYQAGTLSGNPVSVACGLATLQQLQQSDYGQLAAKSARLTAGLKQAADAAGVPLSVAHRGGMFGFTFLGKLPKNMHDASSADIERFKRFFRAMLKQGIYLAPSAYEAGFISFAHSDAVIDETIAAAAEAFKA